MRILHLIPRLDREEGGPSRSVPLEIVGILKSGISADLVVQGPRSPLTEEAAKFVREGGRLHIVPRVNVAEMFLPLSLASRHLASLIKGYDLLHVNAIWDPICHVACRIAHRLGKPFFITVHGMLKPWALDQKWLKKRLGWWAYQRTDLQWAGALRVTARHEAKNLRGLGLTAPVAVIPNAVSPIRPVAFSVRRSFRTALFLSRIHPKKGLLDLVRAASLLRDVLMRGRWRFVVAGYDEGRHLFEVRALAKTLDVSRFFTFLGPVEGRRKWGLYSSADLFILPSYGESFGLVVAEALACGVPVITTRETPWSDIARRRCGWWVPVGVTPLKASLAKALCMTHSELRAMGRRGKRLIRMKYSVETIGNQLRQAYSWLLGHDKKPPFIETMGVGLRRRSSRLL